MTLPLLNKEMDPTGKGKLIEVIDELIPYYTNHLHTLKLFIVQIESAEKA